MSDPDLSFLDDIWRPVAGKGRKDGGGAAVAAAMVSRAQRGTSTRPPSDNSVRSAAARQRLDRITRFAPEVMVKVSGRQRGGSHTAAHLEYIGRHGKLDVETSDGRSWRRSHSRSASPGYPPCGWNCRCGVIPLSARALERRGLKVTAEPPGGPSSRYVRSTGEIVTVPAGIDPGFAYNPGKAHMQGLEPVPRSGPIGTPAIVVRGDATLPPMPPPRPADPDDLLPREVSAEEADRRFLAVLGYDEAHPKPFIDEVGQPIMVGPAMFADGTGRSKGAKRNRGPYMVLAARALADPDEIWHQWVLPNPDKANRSGKEFPRLNRYYIARFVVEGEAKAVMAIFEYGAGGWQGVTAYDLADISSLESRARHGTLAYRRDANGDPDL